MPVVYLGLGSNMGNRMENIISSLKALEKTGVTVTRISRLIETKPVGGPPQAYFLNGAAQITTKFSAPALLKKIKGVEKQFNRIKNFRNGPRPVDIDILIYGKNKVKMPGLIIPHPAMLKRSFVMNPLKEICPDIQIYI